MTAIQANYSNNVGNTQTISKPQTKNDATIEEKKKPALSKGVKIGLGAVAVAASVIAGIAIHNKSVINKAAKKAISSLKNEIYDKVKFNEVNGLDEIFDPNILQSHLDEIAKLPKNEQIPKLNQIKTILSDCRGNGLAIELKRGQGATAYPQNLLDAIASKDQVKIYETYIDYCDNLFVKSKTAGKTIEESIENVLGKGTHVKPHTYDLSKEADRIATSTYTHSNGYTDVTIRSDNMIAPSTNRKNTIPTYCTGSHNPGVSQGVDSKGNPFVEILYNSALIPEAENKIRLLSPDKNLTPAQMDLLKLQDVADLPIEDFQRLTLEPDVVNFDAILSLIQTLASKA